MPLKLLKVIVIFLSYMVIAKEPSSNIGFFTNVFIFTFGLVYDYLSLFNIAIEEQDIYNKIIGFIGFIIAMIFCLISVAGLTDYATLLNREGVFYITQAKDSVYHFSVNYTCFIQGMAFFVVLVGVEMFGDLHRNKNIKQPEQLSSQEGNASC